MRYKAHRATKLLKARITVTFVHLSPSHSSSLPSPTFARFFAAIASLCMRQQLNAEPCESSAQVNFGTEEDEWDELR